MLYACAECIDLLCVFGCVFRLCIYVVVVCVCVFMCCYEGARQCVRVSEWPSSPPDMPPVACHLLPQSAAVSLGRLGCQTGPWPAAGGDMPPDRRCLGNKDTFVLCSPPLLSSPNHALPLPVFFSCSLLFLSSSPYKMLPLPPLFFFYSPLLHLITISLLFSHS